MTAARLIEDVIEDLDDTQNIDPNADPFELLVGEGKKFKSPQDLAKGKLESDAFIQKLQRENAELKNDLLSKGRLDDAIDKLLKAQSARTEGGSNSGDNNNSGEPADNNGNPSLTEKGLTREDLEALLSERENVAKQEQNLKHAKVLLAEKVGPDWQKKLLQKAKEIGESPEFFEDIAKRNPQALLAFVAPAPATKPATGSGLFQSSVNTTPNTMTANNSSVRDKKFYDDLKKRDAATYWSNKTQVQMHKDALELGEAFFS